VSTKTILVVALALACGLSAALGVSRLRQPLETPSEKASIVVAAADIPRGQVLTQNDVELRECLKEETHEGVLTRIEDALDRSTTIPLLKGEPVLVRKLATKDAGRGLAALIPKGMRAYTIQATRVASNVAGFILPGNRVDVLLNVKGSQTDETGGGSTTTLLQSVEILAVDQRLDAPADNKVNPKDLGSITLLVTPEQAALLDLGQSAGQLTLALRNPEDANEAKTRPATLADIRFRQEKPTPQPKEEARPATVPQPKEPEVFEILTLRGSQQGRVVVTAPDQPQRAPQASSPTYGMLKSLFGQR
jgi:pilus assembly protein CpaB